MIKWIPITVKHSRKSVAGVVFRRSISKYMVLQSHHTLQTKHVVTT